MYTLSTAWFLFLLSSLIDLVLCDLSIIRKVTQLSTQQLIFYFFPQSEKHLLYIFILFRTHLIVLYSELPRQLFTLLLTNFPFLAVDLVPHQHLYYIFSGVGLDLFEPVLHGWKRRAVVNRKGHDDAHGSFVISLRYSFESLLACRVPNLHSYLFPVNINSFNLEVDSFVIDELPMVVRCEPTKLF